MRVLLFCGSLLATCAGSTIALGSAPNCAPMIQPMTELADASDVLLDKISGMLPDDIKTLARSGDFTALEAARSSAATPIQRALAVWALDAARVLPVIEEHTAAAHAALDALNRCGAAE